MSSSSSSKTQTAHQKLAQASRCAHAAVEMDNLGNQKEAIDMYTLAIQFLDQALVDPSVKQPNKDVQQCRASYAARIASLRQEMAGSLNTLPQPPAYTAQAQPETATALAVPQDKAVTTQDPTVMQVGVSAIKAANEHGGKYLVQGFQTAKELNERHKVTETVSSGIQSGYQAAVAANEKYKVVDNVKAGVSSAYTSAKELNERHQISQKVGTIATASVKKIGELNRDYKVTEKIGSTFMRGLNYLATQSQDYLASSSSSPSTATTSSHSDHPAITAPAPSSSPSSSS